MWIFTPNFFKFRAFRTLTPERHVFLEFLVENKAFSFSKRVLHADTARNKWLKKALLALSAIGSQPTSLSDVLNLKNLKTIWGVKLIFASTEGTKNIILFWVILENTLGQSVCRIFYFWLVWLVNLNSGGPLLHCTCFKWFFCHHW